MKIRIGNDFKTKWAIMWNGEPEDFSDATDMSLFFNIYDKKIELTKDVDYTVTDNIIEIDVTPDICNILGVYNLELHYTKPNDDFIDGERRSAVDIDAFRIVGKSEKADATQDVSIISDAVAIFLDIAYKKLEEIEANEDVRIANEGEREDAEDIRVANEDIRIGNEQGRQINTTTAISNAEQATLNANNSAVYANEKGAYAEEMSTHPPTIINDYWHIWNFTSNQYESTGQYARGDSAIDGALVVQEKGQSAVNTMSQKAVTDELAQLESDKIGLVKRSFLLDEPINLLDGMVISRKNILTTGANEIQDIASNNSRLMVAEIENGETYTVTKFEGGNVFRIATVDTFPNVLGDIATKYLFWDSSTPNGEKSHTFTNTANAKFAVLQSSNNVFSGALPLMQVERGSAKTEFHEYGVKAQIKAEYLPNDFFEDTGRQPIEGVEKLIGVAFDANNPPNIVSGSVHVNLVSYRVKLEPFEKITIRRVVGNRFALATRNTPNPIEYVRGEYYPLQPTDNLIVSDNTLTQYDFVNNGTAVELWMYASGPVSGGIDPEGVEVLFERTETDVVSKDGFRLIADDLKEDANYAKRGNTERTLAEVEGMTLNNSLALNRKVTTLYTPKDAVVFLTMPPLLDFYAKYDSLMADNPDYISRQVLGQDSQGNDIVQYSFKPVSMKGEEDIIIPKIAITTGTHGDEKPSAYALYNTMKKITSEWREDEVLENFRYNYEFVIIPVVTPSAFIANSRNNINGININRDFPSEAGGSGVGREAETQIVMQFLADNLDIDLFIDYHTDGYYPETNEYAYLIAWDEDIREVFRKSAVSLSAEWRSIYPSVTQDDNVVFASLRTTPSLTTLAYYAHLLDIKSGILETMNTNYISTPVKSEAEITQIMDVEVLVNLINGYFKKI